MNIKNDQLGGNSASRPPNGPPTAVCLHSVRDRKSAEKIREVILKLGWEAPPPESVENHEPQRVGRLLNRYRSTSGRLLLLDAGLSVDRPFLHRLTGLMNVLEQDADYPIVLTALSNAAEEFNPFAGIEKGPDLDPATAQRLVALLGSGGLHEAPAWPAHLALLNAAAVKALAMEGLEAGSVAAHLRRQGGRLWVADDLFVTAPGRPLYEQRPLEANERRRPPAWGRLNQALDEWLRSDPGSLAVDWPPSRPVTLHVSHSWGGGVARWVETFIANDPDGLNFQLRSEGPEPGEGAGQRLSLYLGNKTDAAVARWWLQAPIRSTAAGHEQYRLIIREIGQRFGIGRVIVSSLVGHSLDVLDSGLPTIQVLHDFYPAWPLLGVHPGPYLEPDADGGCLERALGEHALLPDLSDQDAAAWADLARTWRKTAVRTNTRVVAPSRSVATMLGRLDPAWADVPIEIVPHGLPPMPVRRPVGPREREDGRLRLVVPGRVQQGKGRDLLLSALPGLTPFAQVYLVGAGKEGEAFFGQSGVDVILQYRNEDLPEILASIGPHAAALLSVVPETFSYTLSEMHRLDVPVLATKVGSFAERIDDGMTGWLIEPAAEALVATVKRLFEDRAGIDRVRRRLAELEHADATAMVGTYGRLCPVARPAPRDPVESGHIAHSLDIARAESLAFEGMELARRLRRLNVAVTDLQKEVEKRTEWAEERQRVLEEEQKERERHVTSLNAQLDQRFAELQAARDAFAWAQSAQEEAENALRENQRLLAENRELLEQTRVSLEQTQLALEQRLRQYTELKATHDWVLGSTSWRVTRPFRVLRRMMANFMRAQVWNPARWPLLLSQLVRTLRTQGLQGALQRSQVSPLPHLAPEPFAAAERVAEVGSTDGPESFPAVSAPDVSIIVPVFNQWEFSAACLRSLAETSNRATFEVIVVDDQSSDETASRLAEIRGLVTVRNEENLGFIGSCNAGAGLARGRYLVMLNNDTQVLDGWLDALLQTFERYPDTGLAGARLVYPDGRLQEAGGIIFNDGSGWNYGRNDNPDKPEYQFVREVDYCSGACIMLKTEVFRQLNGFDAHYSPAYYEDTDLAFRVRQLGLKVRVQPRATIVHHEGISSGTDIASGIKRYQAHNSRKFLERWRQELAGYPAPLSGPGDTAGLRAARDHRLKGRILVIDAYTPEPDQDSGSVRLTYLLRCMQDLGYGVTFFAENRGHAGAYTTSLQQAGIEVIYHPWLESLHEFFRERGGDFDFVFVSRHYVAMNFISLIERYCPRARFIFDTVDLHYLRESRLAELENSLPLKRVAAQTRRSELAVIEAADATLVVSSVEKSVLETDAPDARVHVISNIHEVVGSRKPWAERKDIFFVGGYQHPPNVDAAIWFVNSIWPLVRERLPEIEFHLIGSKAPDKVSALHGNGVHFHGFVKSLEPWMDGCRLAVAPLRYGAGVKGKVNMSMSRGQPVVATPMAVEGMFVTSGKEVLVAESEQEFADAIVRLYQDEQLWERLSDGGIENVQQYFSVETARRSLQNLLKELG
jgi:GT2 family glycosyltransferase/glycosyltransferase involved in cell wall biosynthesis